MSRSVPEVFASAVAADPTRPSVTYYDDATGERTELSAITLDNWVAKTANLLVDGHGLGAGDTAAVRLPAHWQAAAVLLGCWSAGLAVQYAGQAEIEFVTPDGMADTEAPDVYVLGLAPLAAPMRPPPPAGFADYVVEVRAYGDHFTPAGPVEAGHIALYGAPAVTSGGERVVAHGELVALAEQRAAAHRLGPGDRVLVDAGRHTDPLDWLLAPLVAGASIVLCGHLDRTAVAARIAAERVTRDLTI